MKRLFAIVCLLALLLCIALEQPFETLFYFEDPEQPEA